MDNFIEQNSDILWLVIDNDGWYDAEKIFPDGEPEKLIFIDKNTQHDDTGEYSDCGRAAILMSVYGDDVKDVGLYYLIGSTGKFFRELMSELQIMVLLSYINVMLWNRA